MNDKQIISLLESLIHSEDLKLKVNTKEDNYEYLSTATLTYKGRKLLSVKHRKIKPEDE